MKGPRLSLLACVEARTRLVLLSCALSWPSFMCSATDAVFEALCLPLTSPSTNAPVFLPQLHYCSQHEHRCDPLAAQVPGSLRSELSNGSFSVFHFFNPSLNERHHASARIGAPADIPHNCQSTGRAHFVPKALSCPLHLLSPSGSFIER